MVRAITPWIAAGAVAATAVAACSSDGVANDATPTVPTSPVTPTATPQFAAQVRRTTAGVPHIQANDWGGLGYGYGYAFAEDNLCILEEEIVTARGERARFFGDQPYDLGNSRSRSNVGSDAVYKLLFTEAAMDRYEAAQPEEVRAIVKGYAAGVTRYVRELQAGQYPTRHARCASEPWLRPVTERDLYRRLYKLHLLGSGTSLLDGIVAAKPVISSVVAPRPAASELKAGLTEIAPDLMAERAGELGSNMLAFGREATDGRGGIEFGNPHFPWWGGTRLYQVHLTIPGKLNVEGASLYGAPLVQIGFTEGVAWSHTVSTGYRFTPYMLKLKPGDPFTYLKDGVEKPIVREDISVDVKTDSGAIEPRVVTLYRSEYGPMVYLGNGLFNWTAERAFTYRDANFENLRLLRHYFRWNQAQSVEELARIQREEVAVPWVNTTATDRDGHVYYADITVVPNVPDEMAKTCEVPIYSWALADAAPGLPLLDGSRSECDWRTDPDSAQPGAFGASNLPSVSRDDYVFNCNDSYWISNPKAPSRPFASIIGRTSIPLSLRSRMCHQLIADRLGGRDGLAGTFATVDTVAEMTLGGRVYSAEHFRGRVLDTLCAQDAITLTHDPIAGDLEQPVNVAIRPACDALAAWDGRNNATSRGSHIWDEFWRRAEAVAQQTTIFDVAFDPTAPLDTPRDLRTSEPLLAQAFAAAVLTVKNAGFAFDAPRWSFMWAAGKADEHIPVPGGFHFTGNFTVAQFNGLPAFEPGRGYGQVEFGNSYIQVVGITPAGIDARTFVTYSQSTDPQSPHFDDYTRAYGRKEWVHAAFTEAEVAADTKSRVALEE